MGSKPRRSIATAGHGGVGINQGLVDREWSPKETKPRPRPRLRCTIGNGVATLVVARWTGELDRERLQQGLRAETPEEAEQTELLAA